MCSKNSNLQSTARSHDSANDSSLLEPKMLTFEEWWSKEKSNLGVDNVDKALATEVWDAAIDSASQIASNFEVSDWVNTNQRIGDCIAQKILTLSKADTD